MDGNNATQSFPGLGRARCAQVVLALIAFFTAMDIYVVSLLIEPIKHELDLTDVQVGLANTTMLYGAYALFCVPMGMFADRFRRVRMLLVAMLLWCGGLALTALSSGLPMLVASKAVLGLANAITLPASMSLLSDYFAPEHRAMATSTYGIGQGMGQAGAILIGGMGLGALTTLAATRPDALFGLTPWRVVSLAFAAGGAAILPLLLTVREPARAEVQRKGGGTPREIREFRAFLIPLLGGTMFLSGMSTGVMSWIPPALTRIYGQQPGDFAGWFSAVTLISSLAGLLAGGKLSDVFFRRGGRGDVMRPAAAAAALCAPASFMAVMPGLIGFAACVTLFMIAYAIAISIPVIAINFRIPNELRGMVMGLYVVTVALAGAAASPLVALAGKALGGDAMVGKAMGVIGAPFALGAALCFWWSSRADGSAPAAESGSACTAEPTRDGVHREWTCS
ncbi:MFS transporter [Sphingomonas oryzagri]